MKRYLLTLALLIAAFGLVAARPSIEDLQAQIDALSDATLGGYQRIVVIPDLTSDTRQSVTVTCPVGKVVLGGGGSIHYSQGTGSTGQTVYQSYPVTETSWSVSASTPNPPTGPWQVVGYAICANALP